MTSEADSPEKLIASSSNPAASKRAISAATPSGVPSAPSAAGSPTSIDLLMLASAAFTRPTPIV